MSTISGGFSLFQTAMSTPKSAFKYWTIAYLPVTFKNIQHEQHRQVLVATPRSTKRLCPLLGLKILRNVRLSALNRWPTARGGS